MIGDAAERLQADDVPNAVPGEHRHLAGQQPPLAELRVQRYDLGSRFGTLIHVADRLKVGKFRSDAVETTDEPLHTPGSLPKQPAGNPRGIQSRTISDFAVDEPLHEKIGQYGRYRFDPTIGQPIDQSFLGERIEF